MYTSVTWTHDGGPLLASLADAAFNPEAVMAMLDRRRMRVLMAGVTLAATAAQAQSDDSMERGARAFQAQRWGEAREAFAAAQRAHPRDAAAAYWLGRATFQQREYAEAERWFDRAVHLDGARADHHYWLAATLGQQAVTAGAFRQALLARRAKSELERAIALDPAHLDARMGLVQFHLAAPAILGGSRERAAREAEEIARRDARRGHIARGAVLAARRDWAAVEREYQAAIALAPDSLDAYYALGTVYQRTGRFDDAFEVFEQVLRRRPEESTPWYQIGRTSALSGTRLERAEEALRSYVARTDRGPQQLGNAWYLLGVILEKRGDAAGSSAAYARSRQLAPDQREARALERLRARS